MYFCIQITTNLVQMKENRKERMLNSLHITRWRICTSYRLGSGNGLRGQEYQKCADGEKLTVDGCIDSSCEKNSPITFFVYFLNKNICHGNKIQNQTC